jgi:DNA mismatch repair protein MSH2
MLYQCVAKLHQIIMYLDGDEAIQNHLNFEAFQSALLAPMRSLTEQLSPFVQMIEETIDFDALNRNEYCLRADFDPELQEISKQKSAVLDAIDPEFRRVCQALKLEAGKKCKLERNSIYGYFFRVSRLDAAKLSALRSTNKNAECDEDEDDTVGGGAGCTELATLKSGVLFTTPKLSELARRYDALSEDYRDKQAVLMVSLLRSAQPFRPAFDSLDTLFAMMDVLMSVAHVAGTSPCPYVRPRFSESNERMELRGARHACVEVQTDISFIPNDAEFDRSSGRVLQFITGPNMGGKSTFIRQVSAERQQILVQSVSLC